MKPFLALIILSIGTVPSLNIIFQDFSYSFWPLSQPDCPKITSIQVQCKTTSIQVRMDFDQPFLGMVFSKGHFSDQNCVHQPAKSGATSIDFEIQNNQCGTTSSSGFQSDNGQPNLASSFIENTIIVQYDPLLQMVFDQAKKIRCTWYDYYEKFVTFKPLHGNIKSPYKKVTVKPVEIQKIEEETEDEDLVLDFSSGSAKVVENTATVIEELSEEEAAKGFANAFSKFIKLIGKVGIVKELQEAGNVTIFTPFNEAFDKLPTKIEDLPLPTQRKIVLKHFVKGFVFKKNIKSGPIKTLGGKYIYLARYADTDKVKIFSQSEQSNIKVSDIKTEFGLVHLIDTVLTGNTARFFVKGLDF